MGFQNSNCKSQKAHKKESHLLGQDAGMGGESGKKNSCDGRATEKGGASLQGGGGIPRHHRRVSSLQGGCILGESGGQHGQTDIMTSSLSREL